MHNTPSVESNERPYSHERVTAFVGQHFMEVLEGAQRSMRQKVLAVSLPLLVVAAFPSSTSEDTPPPPCDLDCVDRKSDEFDAIQRSLNSDTPSSPMTPEDLIRNFAPSMPSCPIEGGGNDQAACG